MNNNFKKIYIFVRFHYTKNIFGIIYFSRFLTRTLILKIFFLTIYTKTNNTLSRSSIAIDKVLFLYKFKQTYNEMKIIETKNCIFFPQN